jgi:hypothetical protein
MKDLQAQPQAPPHPQQQQLTSKWSHRPQHNTFGAKRAVHQGEDRPMKAIQLLHEYEAYRGYAVRAKRLGRALLSNRFQEKAIYVLNTLELVLGCRLNCI